jgi:hypothetical protein
MALLGSFVQYLIGGVVLLIVRSAEGNKAEQDSPSPEVPSLVQTPVPADVPANLAAQKSGQINDQNLAKGSTSRLLKSIFVGQHWANLASMFLKALIAFLVGMFLKDSTVLGIVIERGSLLGFATVGFMFGFWPVEKLWKAIASHVSGTAG